MFHGKMDPVAEKTIPSDFSREQSYVRILITTVAFRMGISVNDIREVVHWGPPSSLLGYWQEVGRFARDGMPGRATVYLPARSVDRRTVDESVIDLVSDDLVCLRRRTLEALSIGDGFESGELAKCCGGERCCSRCSHACV